jgi:hypothetical protein
VEEEVFSEELARIRYYSEPTEVPVIEVVREAEADWLNCCYPVRVERTERKRGTPQR